MVALMSSCVERRLHCLGNASRDVERQQTFVGITCSRFWARADAEDVVAWAGEPTSRPSEDSIDKICMWEFRGSRYFGYNRQIVQTRKLRVRQTGVEGKFDYERRRR